MNKSFWNSVARQFDEEIFHVLAGDRNRAILGHIERLRSTDAVAADFGCGTGRCLDALSPRFGKVYAVDFSNKCLDTAREKYAHLENVVFAQHDLAREKVKFDDVAFMLSINTLIMGSAKAREGIWSNLSRNVIKGGHLLLVVPSLESALFARSRVADWNLRSGRNNTRRAFQRFGNGNGHAQRYSIPDGVLNIEDIATKHYLKEELMVSLDRAKFEITDIDKVEYSWASEITDPPRWMTAPYPWDWLVVARKV
jgi:SAM-dependent methyltransferase